MIFFHDKHWFQSHLQTLQEDDEEDDEEEKQNTDDIHPSSERSSSPTPSQTTITSAPTSSAHKKPEYEFLLFNYLLRFVHREGRIGDFARAGLLFLMDVAMSAGEPIAHKLIGDDISPGSHLDGTSIAVDPVADAALALAEYVLDGDFSDVLGAGLGAVYSLLPSKLDVSPQMKANPQSSNTGMMLGAVPIATEEEWKRTETERDRNEALGLESSSSPDFKARLDHFLKLLEFLQDVLRRNIPSNQQQSQLAPSALVGNAIVQSILDSVRSVFLENILYTSILECSDADGSAVAVMAYIDIMIRTLGNSQLGDLLVNFLMSEDDHDPRRPHPRVLALDRNKKERERSKRVRRRKSSAMILLEMEAPESRKQTEYFTSLGRFTLKDLIFSNIRSPYQASVTAAFQLLQSLLTYHPSLCVDKLLLAVRDPGATSFPQPLRLSEPDLPRAPSPASDDEVFIYPTEEKPYFLGLGAPAVFTEPGTTYAMHEMEIEMYLNLLSRIGSSHNHSSFSTGYGNYLNDALVLIQSQSSFQQDAFNQRSSSKFSLHHRLDPNDPLLSLLLKALREFFSHPPEYNMALTGVLASLAMEPYRSLAGWLTFDSSKTVLSQEEVHLQDLSADGDDRSIDYDTHKLSSFNDPDLFAMPLNESLRPVIYSIFLGLVTQLDRFRKQIEGFDKYLAERRQGLLFSENLNDALSLALEFGEPVQVSAPNTLPMTPPRPPSKPKPKVSSFVSFLTPKKKTSIQEPHTPPEPNTPSKGKILAASPFGPHYQETGAIAVQPSVVPLPSSGPWSPAKKPAWSTSDDDVFTTNAQWGDEEPSHPAKVHSEGTEPIIVQVSLSQLLDNVVILEESIKELMAVIHARRSLGIDGVRYI